MRSLIRKCRFGVRLEEVMIRYCRALDCVDQNTAFLKLWGVLEYVTNTGRMSYEHTVRRASYIYRDPFLQRPVLQGLCESRNRSVHAGVDDIARESVVRLHRFVADMILFLLQTSSFFASQEEVGRFLSLPDGKEELMRGVQLRKEALRFKRHVTRSR